MRPLRTGITLLQLVLAVLVTAQLTPVRAQTVYDTAALSDHMLIRLGAAVSGYSNGLPVWVVTCVPDIQVVLTVVPTQREAVIIARDSSVGGRRCIARGPYVGSGDSVPPQLLLASGTVHQPDSKYDSLGTMNSAVLSTSEIQDITITVHRLNGPAITRVYRPGQIDAVFFTLPAMDKFLFPYYQWLYGVEYVGRMRAAIAAHMLAARSH